MTGLQGLLKEQPGSQAAGLAKFAHKGETQTVPLFSGTQQETLCRLVLQSAKPWQGLLINGGSSVMRSMTEADDLLLPGMLTSATVMLVAGRAWDMLSQEAWDKTGLAILQDQIPAENALDKARQEEQFLYQQWSNLSKKRHDKETELRNSSVWRYSKKQAALQEQVVCPSFFYCTAYALHP